MLKQKYFLTGIFILSAERQPIKLAWRKIVWLQIHQPLADEFNWADFLSIGFSHHAEIIFKAKTLEVRLFYIHEYVTRYWSKYTLRDYLQADLYSHRGTLPNNFAQTLPDTKQALKAI